jgi:hypothetical protein
VIHRIAADRRDDTAEVPRECKHSRSDADKFHVLGVALFRITPYRYQFKAQGAKLNAQCPTATSTSTAPAFLRFPADETTMLVQWLSETLSRRSPPSSRGSDE